MKAIVNDKYGSADVLRLEDIDKPVAKDDEVLVRVHAAGMDPSVWHLMTGLPYVVRLMFGVTKPKVRVRGWDVAGTVETVGENVTGFSPGDEVYGSCDGSFAEYACVKAIYCAQKPANLSLEQAAAVPTSGLTALQSLRDKGHVQAGQKVLITGAGGGVGTFAVQLAKTFGAEVTGVCSGSKADLVRSLGADDVVDYTRQDFADGTRHYDLIVDCAGLCSLSRLRRALAPKGTLVFIGGEGGGRVFPGLGRQLQAAVLGPFVGQRFSGIFARAYAKDLQTMAELIEDGKVTPVIDRTYSLSDAPEAIRHWAEGHSRGKAVITV
jgi:NADPH:quinone reductase-like Zn-dependent oxidoreductase